MTGFEEVTIGDCRLINADCRDVLPTLGKFDLLLTDPPYGVNMGKRINAGVRRDEYLSFDDSPEALIEYVIPFVELAISKCLRSCITPGVRNARLYPAPSHSGAIYYPAASGCNAWGFSCWQPILYYGNDPYAGKGSRPDSFQSVEAVEKNGHPCPKPIGQIRWLLDRCSFSGDSVVDPFMGSGTTGVACAQSGRSFTGIERERKYFDIACERIERAYAQGKLFAPEIVKPQQAEIAV